MVDKQDWRLTSQDKYLKGKVLVRKKYRAPSPTWDHDHCAFCWARFMEQPWPDTLQEGYTTEDEYYWICPECFEDFKEMFGWIVREEGIATPQSSSPKSSEKTDGT